MEIFIQLKKMSISLQYPVEDVTYLRTDVFCLK